MHQLQRPDGDARVGAGMSESFALPLAPELLDYLGTKVAEELALRMVPPSQPYMSVDDAAEYLACGRRRIYDLVERGAVACYRDGKRLLFRREDLDTYVSTPEGEFRRRECAVMP